MREPSHRICWNGWNDRNETNGRNETPQLNVYDANRQSQLCSNEALFPFASVFMRQIFSLFNLSIRNGMSCDETRWKRTKKRCVYWPHRNCTRVSVCPCVCVNTHKTAHHSHVWLRVRLLFNSTIQHNTYYIFDYHWHSRIVLLTPIHSMGMWRLFIFRIDLHISLSHSIPRTQPLSVYELT